MSLEQLQTEAEASSVELTNAGLGDLSAAQLGVLADLLRVERTGAWKAPEHAEASRPFKDLLDEKTTDVASELLARLAPPSASTTGPEEVEVERAVEDLRADGLHSMQHHLSSSDRAEIIAALADVEFLSKATNDVLRGYSAASLAAGTGATHWVRNHSDILRIPAVQRLVADPFVLAVVDEYFGTRAIHVQTNCWWTVPTPPLLGLPSLDAQRFHQDREYIRFVKLFVYLTDVGPTNGPHRFVVGSHRDYRAAIPSGYSFSDRLDDATIEANYPNDRIRHIEGPAGTMFLADTTAFHAGMAVEDDHRLLLQIEYANSPYFGVAQPFSASVISEPRLRAAIDQGDRLTLNYDDARYEAWLATRPDPTPVSRSARVRRVARARIGDVVRAIRGRR